MVVYLRRIYGVSQQSHAKLWCSLGLGVFAFWGVGSILVTMIACDGLQSLGLIGKYCPRAVRGL